MPPYAGRPHRNARGPNGPRAGSNGPPNVLAVAGGSSIVRLPVMRPALGPRGWRRNVGLILRRLDVADLGLELLLGLRLGADELVPRVGNRPNELVELELRRLRIAVLRVLDEEHHQEGHDRGPGVDD